MESDRKNLQRNGVGRHPIYVLHFYEYVSDKGLRKNDIQPMKAWLKEQRKKYRPVEQKKIKSGKGHEDKALHQASQAELTFAIPKSTPSKVAESKTEQLTPTQEYEAKLITTQSQLIEMQNKVIALMEENAALKSNSLRPQPERFESMGRNGKIDYSVVV